jgi:hypothetical protein
MNVDLVKTYNFMSNFFSKKNVPLEIYFWYLLIYRYYFINHFCLGRSCILLLLFVVLIFPRLRILPKIYYTLENFCFHRY